MPVSVQALRQGLLPSVTIQQAQHATMHIEIIQKKFCLIVP